MFANHPANILLTHFQIKLDLATRVVLFNHHFFRMINKLHNGHDHILLCLCNSGRRSLHAAHMLRELGYPKALSVAGGFQAWKKLQATAAG